MAESSDDVETIFHRSRLRGDAPGKFPSLFDTVGPLRNRDPPLRAIGRKLGINHLAGGADRGDEGLARGIRRSLRTMHRLVGLELRQQQRVTDVWTYLCDGAPGLTTRETQKVVRRGHPLCRDVHRARPRTAGRADSRWDGESPRGWRTS